jgi:hypothetical protein
MTDPREDRAGAREIVELAQQDSWMLGAEKTNGVVVANRLYLVSDMAPGDGVEREKSIEKINRMRALGRGYHFHLFLDPCLGCEVSVEAGWELTTESMQREFLNRFLKTFDLESK